MTKLESCDTAPEDGTIDAWIPACEFNISSPLPNCTDLVTYRSTTCPNNQNDIYTSAHEEALSSGTIPPNLTWVDVTAPDMHVVRATFLPSPLKIPTLMSGAGEAAESPVVSVSLEVELSTKLRNQSFIRTNMNYPRTLTTTYDLSE